VTRYGQGGEGWKPERPDPSDRTAPKDVAVLREEVFERIKRERTNASEAHTGSRSDLRKAD
jgi:hypothetical protein